MSVILGGGIGGLSAAHYLVRRFPKQPITLFEATHRTGGWIQSNKLENGVIFEQGPRTIRPRGEPGYNTLQLLTDLNLSNEIVSISTSHSAAKNRMIYAKGKLNLLPSSFMGILKTSAPFQKPLLFYIMRDIFAKSKIANKNDESIYDFVERRFGTDIAEYAISPMICGICAGNAKEISVKFLMESLFDKEQKHGSITKGVLYDLINKKKINSIVEKNDLAELARKDKWSIYSFQNGLETLPKTLEKSIVKNGVDISCNKICKNIEFSNKEIYLNINDEQKIATHLISSISSQDLSKLIVKQHPTLANLLNEIKSVSVAVINLQYNQKLNLKDAFGFLVPPSENIPILGVIFDSCCFPNSENTVLTAMVGGYWFEKYFGKNPTNEQLLETALKHIQNILGVEAKPDNFRVNILRNCIPQYVIGHKERVGKIEDYIRDNKLSLNICGSSYYGVGVNDVILGAKNAVMNLNE